MWSVIHRCKGTEKEHEFVKLIGCSVFELAKYIEILFTDNMTWDNYGRGVDKWSIDHIIPCKSFDLTKLEEQAKCFHYTNLQPLWSVENSSKGAKLL
jgi:hypothetical protein